MAQHEIRAAMEKAVLVVNAMPVSKRDVLVISSQPSNSVPRPPVKNEGSDAPMNTLASKEK